MWWHPFRNTAAIAFFAFLIATTTREESSACSIAEEPCDTIAGDYRLESIQATLSPDIVLLKTYQLDVDALPQVVSMNTTSGCISSSDIPAAAALPIVASNPQAGYSLTIVSNNVIELSKPPSTIISATLPSPTVWAAEFFVMNDNAYIIYAEENFAFVSYFVILDLTDDGTIVGAGSLDYFYDSYSVIDAVYPDLSLVQLSGAGSLCFGPLHVHYDAATLEVVHSESIFDMGFFLDAVHGTTSASMLVENAENDQSDCPVDNDPFLSNCCHKVVNTYDIVTKSLTDGSVVRQVSVNMSDVASVLDGESTSTCEASIVSPSNGENDDDDGGGGLFAFLFSFCL